ncbi:MAG: PD40 domain-containing protein, partial [Bacteroidaceae bacterium]|nr:PD40 domain-containing protein [Bacteroidaceae bacterium]
NAVQHIRQTSDELEIFPCWAPDGRTLYYCSAHSVITSPDSIAEQTIERYEALKYDIYVLDFNETARTFSEPRLVYSASQKGLSATLPRLSPDGRFLVFAQGDHGCFHVWHHDADICMIDLQADSLDAVPLETVNSERSESYPSFSSNGRWLMVASRRDDGNYTRPYIAHFDPATQTFSKPFELPQQHPSFYTFCLRSFNRPEFMTEPVTVSQKQFVSVVKSEVQKVKFIPMKP